MASMSTHENSVRAESCNLSKVVISLELFGYFWKLCASWNVFLFLVLWFGDVLSLISHKCFWVFWFLVICVVDTWQDAWQEFSLLHSSSLEKLSHSCHSSCQICPDRLPV